MPAILTNKSRILSADYFSNQIEKVPTYVYIGGSSNWPDEPTPPSIKDITKDRIMGVKELYAAKKINPSDITPVVRRINWTSGIVYDEYSDTADLINEKNPETTEFYDFYVLTSEFNVYKCISNNNRTPSSIMPSGSSVSTFQTPDGYVWKYMYSLNSQDIFEFMTANWMPCYQALYNNNSAQWQTQDAAIPLSINQVVVTNNGTGYDSLNPPTVTINGDGSGATATANIDDGLGEVSSITITSPGTGYTVASVSISGNGTGAAATPVISPIRGHGSDARDELGAHYLMIKVDLEGDEGGLIPTNLQYRKIGIVSEPKSNSLSGFMITVNNPEKFDVGDTVTQNSVTGVVHSINQQRKYLFVKDVVGGIFNNSDLLSSNSANSTVPVSVGDSSPLPLMDNVIQASDILEYSGELVYFSAREVITRNNVQNDSIRLIVTF